MEKEHLPIYGVGPFYGAGIIIATVVGNDSFNEVFGRKMASGFVRAGVRPVL